MNRFNAEIKLNYHEDDVELSVIDCDSGVVVLTACFTAADFKFLVSSRAVELPASIAYMERLSKVGMLRNHVERRNFDGLFLAPSGSPPSREMILYADMVREEEQWDSASWHEHLQEGWCLHLVRWEPRVDA